MDECSDDEPDPKKRRPGRPTNPLTVKDPKRPIDIRQSTYRELVSLKNTLSSENGRKFTYDDVVRHLLALAKCVVFVGILSCS